MRGRYFLGAAVTAMLATTSCGPAANSDGGDASADAASDIGLDSPDDVYTEADGGGVVVGPVDMHCAADGGTIVRVVDPAVCMADGGDDASAMDAGGPLDLGVTMFNASGDDDACKYHIALIVPPITRFADVTFTLTVSSKADGSPVVMASPRAEVFLDPTHPGQLTAQMSEEFSTGVYLVGPVRFNAPGDWTVRFHLFEQCTDGPDSPRAHAAFFVHVP